MGIEGGQGSRRRFAQGSGRFDSPNNCPTAYVVVQELATRVHEVTDGFAWIPVGISLVAVVISVYSVLLGRARDSRDLFLRMHERMVDPDLFRGRQVLFEKIGSADDVTRLRQDRIEDFYVVNRALSILDVFALYAHRGYIDKQLVLNEWGPIYVLSWRHGQYFAAVRRADLGIAGAPWPHLRALALEAELVG